MKLFLSLLFAFSTFYGSAQLNIISTNPIAEQVMLGYFDPADYVATEVINAHDDIIMGINAQINSESLKSYLVDMAGFMNRNTGSDTVSATTGIGAARRWAYEEFEAISAANDNRLIPSYLQFDQVVCGMSQHRNIFAVLPGSNIVNHEVIIIEAHFDSRCATACDIDCEAQGMEDNGSGSALVMELARVMSAYTFENTIVFMLTIGEEQGLYGSNAFSQYAVDNDMPIKAVLNNDVIGGVICGETSSAPSCPGENEIDSTQVRFFTEGGFNSRNKQLARFVKLQYQEELLPLVDVAMQLTIMSAEDRVGRGGDHIPFRQDGFTAMRFTSAHEHGDAGVGGDYHDRQHTSDDILGVDTDGDMELDSFFVDFNYLGRNAVINGIGAAMIAIGPKPCDFLIETFEGPGIVVRITGETGYDKYRVGLRTETNDWDSVYVLEGFLDTIYPPTTDNYIISVASVDEYDIESLFSSEIAITNGEISIAEEKQPQQDFELMQNRPNPFDEATIIGVKVNQAQNVKEAFISIRDLQGKEIERIPIDLTSEMNEVLYHHGYGQVGTYAYTLVVDGQDRGTKMMVFAN
ncbi:MAG: Zn-dependent M28 family amino/carboxypeptidase [Crocinitomix sp.]|jgi:Zn-dependent M28 family amino/carboxypeptidase